MKGKVLLITPPYHCGVLEAAGTWLPVGFVTIAGVLRKAGFEVEIYDAMAKFDGMREIEARISETKPDFVGTGAYTATVNAAIDVLQATKRINPATITLLGGVHPTFCWQEILEKDSQAVDFVIRGEGEITTAELLECLVKNGDPSRVLGVAFKKENEIICTPDRPFVEDLDSLPAAWDLIEWPLYSFRTRPGSTLAIVSTSRGCSSKCTFCSQRLFWKECWRARTPESVVAELEYLNKEYGVDVAMFSDETPTLERKRWEKLLDLLIERDLDVRILMETRVSDLLRDEDIMDKYAKAKVLHVYTGVESASQETLDRFHKDIKIEESKKAIDLINKAGIISETSLILGMPEDTHKSIQATVRLAEHYNPDMCFFLAIAPWPYSEIYEELKPYIKVFDYSKYNLVVPIVEPRGMSLGELNQELLKAFGTFYMHKFSKLDEMSKFKKNYMIAVARLFAEHSYLSDEMKKGKMPEEIKKYLKKISV